MARAIKKTVSGSLMAVNSKKGQAAEVRGRESGVEDQIGGWRDREVTITVPKLGNVDGDVDNNDLNLLLATRNTPASSVNDLRDLNGDGKIDALDGRILVTKCTRPRYATQYDDRDSENGRQDAAGSGQ